MNGAAVDQVIARIGATGLTAWYLTDDEGSVRDLMDNSSTIQDHIDYDAFGNILSESNPTYGDRIKYTGREYDSTLGLYYNRARMYDPTTGRWLSQDPLGFAAGDGNLYRYVGNSPTNATDPSGMLPRFPNGIAKPSDAVVLNATQAEVIKSVSDILQEKLAAAGVGKDATSLPAEEGFEFDTTDPLIVNFLAIYGDAGKKRLESAYAQGYVIKSAYLTWTLHSWTNDDTPGQRSITVSTRWGPFRRSLDGQAVCLNEALDDRFKPSPFFSKVFESLNLSGVQFRYIERHPELFDDAIIAAAQKYAGENSLYIDYLSATVWYNGKQKAQEVATELLVPHAASGIFELFLGVFNRARKTGRIPKALKALEKTGDVNAPNKTPVWSSTPSKTSVENALGHWNKHGSEFPQFQNAKQYVEGAHNFVKNPPPGSLTKVRPNGEKLFYDPATNTFAVQGVNGAPKTMFKPTDGINYWNKQ